MQIGDINEAGFLKNFEYKGITTLAAYDELLSNSYDAKAKNVFITNGNNKWITISDDGLGLNANDAKYMFSMYKEKERYETIGMANAGAKYSLYSLSHKIKSIIISLKDGIYITIIIDWNKMIKEGKYTKNITLHNSTEDEIALFNTIERTSGTTILNPYYRENWELLEHQFKFTDSIDILKSFAVRYAHMDFNITLVDHLETRLKKYNPSNKENEIVRRIDILKKGNEILYVSDLNEVFKPKGRGTSTECIIITQDDLEDYTLLNTLNVYISLPYDEHYHKDAKSWVPKELDIFQENCLTDKEKASQYPVLVRNNYTLGNIIMDEIKLNSRHGSYKSRLYFDIHTIVKFKQNSMNSIDHIIGTQENKGQLHDNIHTQLKRLIHKMKQDYIEKELPKDPEVKHVETVEIQPRIKPAFQSQKDETKSEEHENKYEEDKCEDPMNNEIKHEDPMKNEDVEIPGIIEMSEPIVVREHFKNKIPDDLFAKMIEDLKNPGINATPFGVEIYNRWVIFKK